jgi:hypothetical protein
MLLMSPKTTNLGRGPASPSLHGRMDLPGKELPLFLIHVPTEGVTF